MIHTKTAFVALSLLIGTSANAQNPLLVVGQPDHVEKYHWRSIDVGMSDEEYRRAYRDNQDQLLDFVEDYSESTLMAMGMPRKGVHMMGAVAGAAITQEATLYLNSSKSLALDIKNAAEDDRAIYIGFELDW
jgi:hypothetical protein